VYNVNFVIDILNVNEKRKKRREQMITNKEKDYHVTYMKPFFFNPLTTDPIDVARKDYLGIFV